MFSMNSGKTLAFAITLIAAVLGAAAAAPKFEVASVKPVDANSGPGASKSENGAGRAGTGLPLQVDHGRYAYTSSLFAFILQAYGIQTCDPNLDCAFVSGGPDWLRNDKFEIQAKIPDGTPDYTTGQLSRGEAPELQLMLQSLLADRFNLKVHREQRELPAYALTVAKGGPKPNLKKAAGEMVQTKDGSFRKDNTLLFLGHGPKDPNLHVTLTVKNRPMREFVTYLSHMMNRPVLDRTGLAGEFDFGIDYEMDPDAPPGNPAMVGPSMFTAFQDQLGLKLESTRAPVEVLMIDHAERPSKN